jgi:RNA-binding protein YlmH
MFDKEKLLSHLHREDDRLLGDFALDKIEKVLERKSTENTNFLNPYQRKVVLGLIKQVNGVNYIEEGGYKKAERKRIVVFPDYLFPDHVESSIEIIKVNGNFNFKSLSHKDFLGSILSLGIKREMIGDILVLDEFGQIIIAKELYEFIKLNFNKVNEVPIEISKIDNDDLIIPTNNTKDISTTVASMRLDAVASAGFGDSRNKISRDIKNNRVKLNFKVVTDPACEVELEDLISIRNRGRVEVAVRRGFSNRGRIKLLLKRYT